MKKLIGLFTFFVSLCNISFSQYYSGAPGPLEINNTCLTAQHFCGEGGISQSFDSLVSCEQMIAPQFLKMRFSGSGVFELRTPAFINSSATVPYHTGSYTLYGPFNSFGVDVCELVALGQTQEQSGSLGANNLIQHQQGFYILKVVVDNCVDDGSYTNNGWGISIGLTSRLSVCEDDPNCQDCITSFSPDPGEYIISGWVMGSEDNKNTSYTNPFIDVSFIGGGSAHYTVSPSGPIIDGWQKVEGVVSVPPSATDILIQLDCQQGVCHFDDIRFIPVDGSMKSYVYDPITLKLVAELDERNYATFYEYDEEGKLIRVKKETEKGIMTIQENRNSIVKQ